jgi:hypothetical protein
MARGIPETIQRWHVIALERRADDLAGILAEDCVFESPVVHMTCPRIFGPRVA